LELLDVREEYSHKGRGIWIRANEKRGKKKEKRKEYA
jgi:hypothetical protein